MQTGKCTVLPCYLIHTDHEGHGEGRGNKFISFSVVVIFLAGNRDFCQCQSMQTTSGPHPVFYSMYNEDCFLEVKWLRHDAHLHPIYFSG
jgi:hypothetical protein